MHSRYLLLCSITPSITSLACARVILELRGLLLDSGTESPLPYASDTVTSYHDPKDGRKDHLGGSRRRDPGNLSSDFFVSSPGGTIGHSTSVGAYEFTNFGNTTFGMEVSSIAAFTGRPSSTVLSAQSPYGAGVSNHDQ